MGICAKITDFLFCDINPVGICDMSVGLDMFANANEGFIPLLVALGQHIECRKAYIEFAKQIYRICVADISTFFWEQSKGIFV